MLNNKSSQKDYSSVTEVTGYNVTQDQLDRFVTRYRFAYENFNSGRVLEIACGSGQGLGYMARKADEVYGVDIDEKLVEIARNFYSDRPKIHVSTGDAHSLDFEDGFFSQVILFECIYYFDNPEKALKEIHRVLAPGGNLIYCSVNPEWDAFNPSPFSKKYYSASETYDLFKDFFADVEIFKSSPASPKTGKDKLISAIKKMAVKLNLIPGNMKSKELLKKLFMGNLKPLPGEIQDSHGEPHSVLNTNQNEKITDHKVIFAKALK